MFDTLNTSIVGMPCCCPPQQPNQLPGNVLHAQKQFVPGGVMFSFNTQPPPQPQGFLNQQVCCTIPGPSNYCPMTLEQQMAVNAMQKHGLETLQYQQQLANNPFLLKFHHNSGTSCSDLLNAPTQVPCSHECGCTTRTEDKAQQAESSCSEKENDPEKLRKKKKKVRYHKIKKKKDSESSESSDEEANSKNPKTTRIKKRRKNKSDSQYYSTTSD